MSKRIYLNNDWKFTESFSSEILNRDFDYSSLMSVRIPHTVKETSFHYFDEHEYQMVSGYVRQLNVPKEWEDKSVRLTIDGAAHSCEIFVNGASVGKHNCGYTAVTVDISDDVIFGKENTIVVKVDSRENQNIPPFGYVIDYMTYGGIYRDVYLEISEQSFISDVYVTTKQAKKYQDSEGDI